MREEIIEIVKKFASPNVNVHLNADIILDLALDSLSMMQIISVIEEKYKISMDYSKLMSISTIGELINYIESI